ncbi:hypothetical protein [Bacillus gobiensis]|uniref:hypothetical protein n=1 Tax=Bacillus gobiensis TaxID=1441095 RepID=UPI003D1AA098
MIKNLFKKSYSEKDFWNWFEKNSEDYFQLKESRYESLFNKLHSQLSKINPDLVFEFSAELDSGKREFIISADGIVAAFPDVIRLVEAAPELKNFNIIAFRQRGNEDEIQFNDIELNIDDMFFTYKNDQQNNLVNVIIYMNGFTEENEEFIGAAFIMLDNLVGEYDVGVKIGEIEFRSYQGEKDAISIKELPAVVDAL